jgi:REP element-mobilizing transposase RayT
MLDDHGYEIYEQEPFPLAFLLTIRTFGTWLHGDEKGSFQRLRNRGPRSKWIDFNVPLAERMDESMKQQPTILTEVQRKYVDVAIREVCDYRGYSLKAANVRTNHAHVVVHATVKPEKIVNEFKAFATRRLRLEDEFTSEQKIRSRGASTRYLWKPSHLLAAVDYVL